MPELPEVEVARRALEAHCVGKRIVRCVAADDARVLEGVSPSNLEAALVGKSIAAACRRGKHLWLALQPQPSRSPTFQFGMTGAIYIKGVETTKYKRSAVSSTEEWPSKFSKVFVELDDGLEFSFTDKRRFARVRLLNNPESVPPISELGPDALSEPMQINDFVNALSQRKIAIKALLLDQSFISGIGNWIADEVLYQSRIHPMEIASNLSKESSELLHRCIKMVIERALEVGADSSQYPQDWICHSREKKPGKAFVDGKEIEFITSAGRTSAFVPELQKLAGGGSSKAPSTSKASKNSRQRAPPGIKDKEIDGDSKPQKGRRARQGGENKSMDIKDDDRINEEPAKPAKRTERQPAKRAQGSPGKRKKAGATDESDADDHDDVVKTSKTTKTQRSTVSKSSTAVGSGETSITSRKRQR